jgi:hypothetical protein
VLIKSVNVIDSFASPGAIGSWWKKREKSRYSKWKRRNSWKSGTNTRTLLIGKTLVTPQDKAQLKQYNPTRVWQSKSETIQPHKNLLLNMSRNFNFILLTSK